MLTSVLLAVVAISMYGADNAYAQQSLQTEMEALTVMIMSSHILTGYVVNYLVIGIMVSFFVGFAWKYGVTWLRGHNLASQNQLEESAKTAQQTPPQFAAPPPTYMHQWNPPPQPPGSGQQPTGSG